MPRQKESLNYRNPKYHPKAQSFSASSETLDQSKCIWSVTGHHTSHCFKHGMLVPKKTISTAVSVNLIWSVGYRCGTVKDSVLKWQISDIMLESCVWCRDVCSVIWKTVWGWKCAYNCAGLSWCFAPWVLGLSNCKNCFVLLLLFSVWVYSNILIIFL